LLRALTERRLLRISSGVLEASEPIEPIVPRTVSESVAERAGRLSRSARDLLNWAAVLPEPIERGWLEAMGGQVVDVDLEALVGASFLVSVLPALLRFAHSLVRDAVYESMPVAERRRRHGVVADLLGEARAPQQAPQLAAAGRLEEAAGVYLDLADEALLRGGNDDAAALSGLAESLASRAEAADLQREAAMMLVQALLRSGDVTGAKARAAEFLIELRGQGLTAERLLFLSRYAVGLWDDASDLEAAKAALTDAAELIPLADGHVLAEAAFAQAHILDRGGAPARALPFAERAVAVARETGDRLLELRALTSLGLIVGQVRSAEEGMALLRQAVSIASDEDSPKDAALAYLDLSYLAQVSGDEERGEQFAREGLTLPHLPPALEALLRGNVALGPMNRGDLDTALAYLLSAQAVASRAGPKTAARIGVQLCFVHVMRGELEEAEALLYGISPPAGSWEHYRMLEPWGMLLEERGETEAALRCYLEGGAAVDHPVALWCLGGAVRAAVTAGELETAREALTRLEELGSRWPASSWLIEASRGLLAGATGRVAEGGRLLEQAAQACPEAFHSARLPLEAARLRGDRDGITRAIAAYDAMGAHHAGDRTRALARSLGMRPGRRRKQDSLLSEREQQIALLVASGKTNPEIAKDLFLSRKTVERHVSSVLEKLNLRSRVELAKEVAAGRLPGISS
jgi:DNA-binding CsgD family transcriptional regulator